MRPPRWSAGPPPPRVWISGIQSAADYARAPAALGRDNLVRDALPQQARGDGLLVRLNLNVTLDSWLANLGADGVLRAVSARPPLDGIEATPPGALNGGAGIARRGAPPSCGGWHERYPLRHLPNALSLLRMLLTVPLAWWIGDGRYEAALGSWPSSPASATRSTASWPSAAAGRVGSGG